MSDQPHAPTLPEIWDFLVGLKEVTEAGFTRVASEIGGLRVELRDAESSLRTDVARLEARVARIEGWNLDRRFDALDLRVARLEQAWPH